MSFAVIESRAAAILMIALTVAGSLLAGEAVPKCRPVLTSPNRSTEKHKKIPSFRYAKSQERTPIF
jgi:hypothetical protein